MENRIILTKADFSQNNIGRYVELSQLTKKVLSKQTQYNEGSAEAIALNEFLDELTNNGYIGGTNPILKTLIIPALANSHDEFLYNIAFLDSDGYPTDEMSSDEKTAEIKALYPTYSGTKIVGVVKKYTEAMTSIVTQITKQATINTHLESLSDTRTYPDYSIIVCERGGFENIPLFEGQSNTVVLNASKAKVKLIYANKDIQSTIISNTQADGIQGFSIKKDSQLLVSANYEGYSVGETTINSISTYHKESMKFAIGANYFSGNVTMPLFAFGAYMQQAKLNELVGIVNRFINKLGI